MIDNPLLSDAELLAAVDLIGRTGATNLEFGFLRDDVPMERAGWYAHARYRGVRITVEDQPGPIAAVDGLARRLLDGGQCQHCRGIISLDPAGQVVGTRTLVDGVQWTAAQQAAGGVCVWRRSGAKWLRGCGDHR